MFSIETKSQTINIRLLILCSTLILFFAPLKAANFNKTLASLTYTDTTSVSIAHKCRLNHTNEEPPFQLKTIVIDAGHGGKDPGCSGKDSHEKHLALAIAKKFGAAIRSQYPEMNVILTRDKDIFIPLYERAAIANRAKADLFVSIHCNALPSSKATAGSETYVMGLHTANHNLDVAKRENDAILLEADYEQNYDYDPNSDEGHILLSMYQNAFLEQSIQFAERVEHHFHVTAHRKSRGVKQAGFVVLKETAMPSVLVETGFLTSASEEAFLKSSEGQDTIANALLLAFAEYKIQVEGGEIPANGELIADIAIKTPKAQPAKMQNAIATPSPQVQKQRPSSTIYSTTNQPIIPKPAVVAEHTVPETAPQVLPHKAHHASSAPIRTESEFSAKSVRPNSVQAINTTTPPTAPPSPVYQNNIPHNTAVVVHAEPKIQMQSQHIQSTSSQVVLPTERTSQASPATHNVHFSVQLAASPVPLDTRQAPWTSMDYLIEVVQEDLLYKYQVTNLKTTAQAFKVKLHLQTIGFKDAFIVSYNHHQRIGLAEARRLLGE